MISGGIVYIVSCVKYNSSPIAFAYAKLLNDSFQYKVIKFQNVKKFSVLGDIRRKDYGVEILWSIRTQVGKESNQKQLKEEEN